jgi:hypothetical protein
MIAETEVIPERNLYIEPEPVVVYPTPAALALGATVVYARPV